MLEVTLETNQEEPNQMYGFDEKNQLNYSHYRPRFRSHVWRPPTDVYETKEAILIKVEIAGMRESDFSIVLDDRKILIQGTRQDSENKLAYHQMEIRNGEFSTEITLHWPVESGAVEADYKDGFLRILLPKAKTYQIDINE